MKEKIIQYTIQEFDEFLHLPTDDQKVLAAARQAAENAYAPYSGYHVGAAVLLANGEILSGNNQENAAYPSGLCAERTVLFYASARFPGVPVSVLAVTAPGKNKTALEVAKPCGACRQVMAEYEDLAGKPIRIILDGVPITVLEGVDVLLPLRFKRIDLDR